MTVHLAQQQRGVRPLPGATCRFPPRRRSLGAAAQARPERLESTLPQPSSLERLYLSAAAPPPPAAAAHLQASRGAPDQARAAAQQPDGDAKRLRRHRKPRRKPHHQEVCGKLVCVDVELFGDGLPAPPAALAGAAPAAAAAAAVDGAAAAPAAVPGLLGRLLEAVPMSPRTRGITMLLVLVVLVATNWVVVKDVGGAFDPLGFAFLRFAVAALAFSPFMKAASKDSRIMSAGMELGWWTAAGYITQSLGLLTTDASRASFLSTFTVLVVPLLAGMSGKGVSAVTWAACLAALAGMGLLEQSGAPPGVGDAWSMASAVAFGIQMFRTEHFARILGNEANLPLMSVVLTTTMGFAALASGVAHWDQVADWVQHPAALQAALTGDVPWAQVFYTGLLTTDLALLLEILALQSVSSVDAAIIYTLEPVLGATFAWALLGERLGPTGMVGAGVIVASCLATQLMGGSGDSEPSSSESEAESESEEAAPSAARLKEE